MGLFGWVSISRKLRGSFPVFLGHPPVPFLTPLLCRGCISSPPNPLFLPPFVRCKAAPTPPDHHGNANSNGAKKPRESRPGGSGGGGAGGGAGGSAGGGGGGQYRVEIAGKRMTATEAAAYAQKAVAEAEAAAQAAEMAAREAEEVRRVDLGLAEGD